jgi:hypothetical protein
VSDKFNGAREGKASGPKSGFQFSVFSFQPDSFFRFGWPAATDEGGARNAALINPEAVLNV